MNEEDLVLFCLPSGLHLEAISEIKLDLDKEHSTVCIDEQMYNIHVVTLPPDQDELACLYPTDTSASEIVYKPRKFSKKVTFTLQV